MKYTNSERYLEAVDINKRILDTTEERQRNVTEMENLKKAIVRSNLAKKNKRFKKQKKKSSTTLKLAPLKSWLHSKESSSASSGDDTEIIVSSDSESENKRKSKNTGEKRVSTEHRDEWMKVTDPDEAACGAASASDPPVLDDVQKAACSTVSASDPPVLDEVQEASPHCADFL